MPRSGRHTILFGRIEQVELLMATDDKTYIIAEKVGYPEQNYFSYVFKKKFGVSPTRYRTAHRSGEA